VRLPSIRRAPVASALVASALVALVPVALLLVTPGAGVERAVAQLPAPSTGNTAAVDPVLRAGTPVPMRTIDPLDTRRNRQGERFGLVVTDDIRVGRWTVIPKGSRATGEIARLAPRSSLGQSGRMELMLLHVDVGAARIRLDGRAGASGRGSTADNVATTAFAFAFAPFVTGKSAVLPAGSPMTGYVQRDMPIAPVESDPHPQPLDSREASPQ
jgi:hypothetical protein